MPDNEKGEVSINYLTLMVNGGFDEIAENLQAVNHRLDKIDGRLDRIENILIAGHDRRIERLEDTMRQVVTALKIK